MSETSSTPSLSSSSSQTSPSLTAYRGSEDVVGVFLVDVGDPDSCRSIADGSHHCRRCCPLAGPFGCRDSCRTRRRRRRIRVPLTALSTSGSCRRRRRSVTVAAELIRVRTDGQMSQTLPKPSPSVSCCMGFAMVLQLSQLSLSIPSVRDSGSRPSGTRSPAGHHRLSGSDWCREGSFAGVPSGHLAVELVLLDARAVVAASPVSDVPSSWFAFVTRGSCRTRPERVAVAVELILVRDGGSCRTVSERSPSPLIWSGWRRPSCRTLTPVAIGILLVRSDGRAVIARFPRVSLSCPSDSRSHGYQLSQTLPRRSPSA